MEGSVICDVCKRDLRTKTGTMVVGLETSMVNFDNELKVELERVYPELDLKRRYRVCHVCLLRQLGVKLPGRGISSGTGQEGEEEG